MAASSPPTPDNHPAAPPHPGAGCVRLVVEEEGDQRHAQAKVQQHDDQQHQQRPAERKEGRSVDALLVRSTGRRVEGGGEGAASWCPAKAGGGGRVRQCIESSECIGVGAYTCIQGSWVRGRMVLA